MLIFRGGNIEYRERKQEEGKLTWISVKYHKTRTGLTRRVKIV